MVMSGLGECRDVARELGPLEKARKGFGNPKP